MYIVKQHTRFIVSVSKEIQICKYMFKIIFLVGFTYFTLKMAMKIAIKLNKNFTLRKKSFLGKKCRCWTHIINHSNPGNNLFW